MSVNLLPSEEARQQTLRRRALLAGGMVLVLWAVLAAAAIAQLAVVDDRVAERDSVAQRAALLRAQVDSLAVFQAMADDAAAGNQVLAFAMADEVSWAELLVDLSRTVPEDASFTDIAGQLIDPPPGGAPSSDVFVQGDRADVGFFTVAGYTTEVFTPGLEDLLRRFGAIDGFFQQYLSTAQREAIGDVEVTRFNAEVRLDDSARTDRYATGLPEAPG